ncbi:lamin tail domain-containing protein [candidate division WS5 bacterium]|uniref:Lamin tail domain-containing protein n=1 Tax=candidate division WS5 bacterium TaxID=2093353 RepID=A0A419DFX8_9BACT|nr:MAG: lamin tail domain-containing protein [candidate division WS5 bacterium]
MFKKYLLAGLFLFWVILAPVFAIGQENEPVKSEAVSTCEGIMITEIMPDPPDGTEWAELHNNNDFEANIKGCWISDISSGTHFYEIKDDLVIQAKEYYAYYSETSLSLNDSPGDGARLFDKDKATLRFETPVYDIVKKGESFAYNEANNSWKWTPNLTPGSLNVFASDDNTSDDEEDENSEGVYNSCSGIMITEIMPSPAGPDEENEWIELYNSNGDNADLGGCILSDKLKAGSTKKYTIPSGISIASGGYLKLGRPETKITLNNDSDGVILMNSNGVVVFDTGLYMDADEAMSFAYHEGQWLWSQTPTPGSANVITEPPAKEAKSSKDSKKKASVKKPPKSTKKAKNSSKKDLKKKDGQVLGASTDGENGAKGPIDDKVMGYILVALSAILLIGYVAYINKDFLYENTIKKLRRNG